MSTFETSGSEIAIIGISGRFPDAGSVEAFWTNLCDGVESIRPLADDDLRRDGVSPEVYNAPNYVKAKAVLADIEKFDAQFFGFSPREAEILDPQQRIFLECAWEALENAGYDASRYRGLIGVFAGASKSGYAINLLLNPDIMKSGGSFQIGIGNDVDHLATRIAYKLNLKGPSVSVQTACSTSLVAIHLACQSLLSGDCDMAMAGGVSVSVPHRAGYFYQEGGITSPDGHCRAFDSQAAGTVSGNGAGIVVLKRLSDAMADGDTVHAVIKGSSINNDGSQKVGYTAPGVEGQAAVISDALAVTGVEAESITYIEAHGTGTPLGDPIEVRALTQAFAGQTQKKNFCALGSVKTNIGHLDAAAGVAGLIKAALALKHRTLPPSLHFEQPNPELHLDDSPFYVNAKLRAWETDALPRRAGVSSFGIGGTNVHAILEEAPAMEPSGESREWQMLTLSARSVSALNAATENLAEHLRRHPELKLADVAYTLHVGRKDFDYRRAVVCRDAGDALTALGRQDAKRVFSAQASATPPPVVFMFPGGGAQYGYMGRELYEQERIFREQFDECAELLRPHTGFDLREVLFAEQGTFEEASRRVERITLSLPAIFSIEYSLAKQLMAWGVRPEAFIGHSLGEYTAACLSGVLSLEDALALVAFRSRLFEELPEGSMLSINLSEAEVAPYLNERISIAAINTPGMTVVSGLAEDIEALSQLLEAGGVEYKRLHLGVAAHSAMVEPVLAQFREFFEQVELHEPRVPYISNVTGTWITAAEAMNPDNWVRHLRQSVRFADGIQQLLMEPERVLLEVGPGHTLKMLSIIQAGHERQQVILSSMPHPQNRQSEVATLLTTLGQLWLAGVPVKWAKFYQDEQRRRVPLPTYPFERKVFWVERQQNLLNPASSHLLSGKAADITDWFYLPSWKRTMPSARTSGGPAADPQTWLVFAGRDGLSGLVVERLCEEGHCVFTVFAGESFERVGFDSFVLNPASAEDYDALAAALDESGIAPRRVLHLWSLTEPETGASGAESFESLQQHGYFSLLSLTQGLMKTEPEDGLQVSVVSNRLHDVSGDEKTMPEKATLLSPCKVIPQEASNVKYRSIDVVWPQPTRRHEERLAGQILAEIATPSDDYVVAYRGDQRLVQDYERLRLEETGATARRLREEGVYWIIGGLGRVGLHLADYLVRAVRARLVLTVSSDFPERSAWESVLATPDAPATLTLRIRKLLALEEAGAQVLILRSDVADEEQMRRVVAAIEERFGRLDGVIHAATHRERELNASLNATRESARLMFRPKVAGLYALEQALGDRPLDFCMLISSNASVLGGLGFITYAAANLFVDAFAADRNKHSSFPWLSTSWDGWLTGDEAASEMAHSSMHIYSMLPAESTEAFRRVLTQATTSNVIVSTGDLQNRLRVWIKKESDAGDQAQADPDTLHARPELGNEYVAPRNDIEEAVAEIWQNLLGIRQLGVHDNFFELGGHSLLAIQVVARVREAFQVQLPVRSLFENATIEEFSSAVEQVLIEEVEAMGEDEAQRLLQSEG